MGTWGHTHTGGVDGWNHRNNQCPGPDGYDSRTSVPAHASSYTRTPSSSDEGSLRYRVSRETPTSLPCSRGYPVVQVRSLRINR